MTAVAAQAGRNEASLLVVFALFLLSIIIIF
jgi:hypothetical protein